MPNAAKEKKDPAHAVKETLISIAISFVMAFVFRGFVIEGFQIPTGSMAPTLLGKHMLIEDNRNGYAWTVGPWDYANGNPANPPLSRQGAQPTRSGRPTADVKVNNPVTDAPMSLQNQPIRYGDRIFVIKYLEGLHDPERWDVVVFKNPATRDSYIKRLLGLPGEQVALIDGDVFTRPFEDGVTPAAGIEAWTGPGWEIQRKDERTQRTMLQTVYDARHNPVSPGPEYRSPWTPDSPGRWTGLRDAPEQTFEGGSNATLTWSANHPITDWYPYNQTPTSLQYFRDPSRVLYPVSDLAVSLSFEPGADGAAVSPTISARGREFRARISAGAATLEMRERDADSWVTVDEGAGPALDAGTPVEIEFWHVDQALWLFVDGDLIAGGPEDGAYTLSPAQRVLAATGTPLDELLERPGLADPRIGPGVLADPSLYEKPGLRWSFEGGPFTVRRMTVKRDIHYQLSPQGMSRLQPTFGGDPGHFPSLRDDQFYVCGDNSPSSKDGRLWTRHDGGPDPWVADQFDDTVGVVPRDLMIGRAFVVYFPSPLKFGQIPIPDAGRVRWIW